MSTVRTAADALGGPSALARLLQVSAPAVHQWISGARPLPVERCPAIEQQCYPNVTCEQLRPDVRWVRVPDAEWPHPAGRPLIDVAPMAVEVRDAA